MRKMSVNGVAVNARSESCKREHEEESEEANKKICTEASITDEPKKSSKRHKHAMLLGYNGSNYHGMQFNRDLKTIESQLFEAFAKVGIMKENEVNEPYAIRFQRAARTDKTVSAVNQVVSLLMTDNLCKPEDINVHLPPDIRVFSFKRVTKGFDSKRTCDGRTYSYILPTQVFSQEPLKNFSEIDYRITPDIINKINEVLSIFVGTHNFHNFTSKRHFQDPRAKRYIMSFKCGEPFVKEKEFILLTVTGQSFILHQIRKMVGATIGIIRGLATPDIIHTSFLSEKIRIPLAPGDGLFLESPNFEKYNRKFGNDGFHEKLTWEDVEEEIKKFRQEKIINVIIEKELESKPLINWVLNDLELFDQFFKPHTDEDNHKSIENVENGGEEEEDDDDEESKLKNDNKN